MWVNRGSKGERCRSVLRVSGVKDGESTRKKWERSFVEIYLENYYFLPSFPSFTRTPPLTSKTPVFRVCAREGEKEERSRHGPHVWPAFASSRSIGHVVRKPNRRDTWPHGGPRGLCQSGRLIGTSRPKNLRRRQREPSRYSAEFVLRVRTSTARSQHDDGHSSKAESNANQIGETRSNPVHEPKPCDGNADVHTAVCGVHATSRRRVKRQQPCKRRQAKCRRQE